MMQAPATFAVWKPHASRQVRLPLAVRSVGRYIVDPTWRERPKKKAFHQLFWVVDGEGQFRADKQWLPAGPGDIFLYHPGDIHDVQGLSPRWTYCWVTWDHPDTARWLEGFGLAERVQRRGACPEGLFNDIADGLRQGVPEGRHRAARAAYALLLEAATWQESDPRPNTVAERARAYLDDNYADPRLSVATVAKALGVHRTTLFRVFQSTYHISPLHYLHNRRLERALALLQRPDLLIHEAALQAGFADANYFSRAVKRLTGMNPREFRAGPRAALASLPSQEEKGSRRA